MSPASLGTCLKKQPAHQLHWAREYRTQMLSAGWYCAWLSETRSPTDEASPTPPCPLCLGEPGGRGGAGTTLGGGMYKKKHGRVENCINLQKKRKTQKTTLQCNSIGVYKIFLSTPPPPPKRSPWDPEGGCNVQTSQGRGHF